MNIFDLHCDSLYEMYTQNAGFVSNNLAVSLDKYKEYDKKAQVFAVWSDKNLSDDEAYLKFLHIADFFRDSVLQNGDDACICTSANDLINNIEKKLCCILAVEDARILSGNTQRLERLYEKGVRVLTLCWKGESCIGGAFDTDTGLSPFGFEVLKKCEELGIIVDVSHLSQKSFWDVASKATKPFIASHSCSAAVCPHERNLSDTQYRTILQSGGVVGVNFAANHLSKNLDTLNSESVFDTVKKHILHYLEISECGVCTGSDFDGTAPLSGLENISKCKDLYNELYGSFGDKKVLDKVFFDNAFEFFSKNL